MIDNQILKDLSLNEKETAIYLACFSDSSQTVSKLAKETQIQRTHLYDLCKKLVEKGFLVQSIQNNKKVFISKRPNEIYEYEKTKLKKFKENLPQLEKLVQKDNKSPKIVYFQGEKELNSLIQTAKIKQNELLVFDSDEFYQKEGEKYQSQVKNRIKNKVFCRSIAGISNLTMKAKQKDKNNFREIRLLPNNLFSSQVSIGIHINKVYIINYQENYGYAIHDKNLAKTLTQLFEIVWESPEIVE